MNITNLIKKEIKKALKKIGILNINNLDIKNNSNKEKYGDYQINGLISIAKKKNISSYDLAKKIVPLLNLDEITEKIEIINPGFINIFLKKQWIEKQVNLLLKNRNFRIQKNKNPKTIIVDYSSPNVAKEMHVGHLRSTIIGDSIVRILKFLGHKVIKVNHIGDWGTQFGMILAYITNEQNRKMSIKSLKDLNNLYLKSQELYKKNTFFAKKAKECIVKLQSGYEKYQKIWKKIVNITIEENQKIYKRLNISLKKKDIVGESFYKKMLPKIIFDLKEKKIAIENNGATVVYLDKFKKQDGNPLGIVIQKKDGGFLYTTIEIACIKYRYEKFHANRILYYIDSRQQQHLTQSWIIAKKAGYIPKNMKLEHHNIGLMLNKNGKPFKTRSGGTINLNHLLDEAERRALNLIKEKKVHFSCKNEKDKIINAIGIGSIKYADLSKNRTTNYIFDWNKIISFNGNTAPYMQYAYARINSIFKKHKIKNEKLISPILIQNKYEKKLTIHLLKFEEIIINVSKNGLPNIICSYLYNLTKLFSIFYESCPILYIKDKKTKQSRLKLALLTKKTLKIGLNLLGIHTIDKM
ncbi:MAG: arginine--tRNA ligase [Arsenophonus sp.]|nr:MAG: arginine--tRNA ligase [Arsenophonus sp.]